MRAGKRDDDILTTHIGKNIDRDIIKVLKENEHPVSTREIALKIDRAWHSVNTHCLKLQLQGKIHGFRAGRMNLWEIKGEINGGGDEL